MDLTALLEAAGISPAVAALAVLAAGYVLAWLAAVLPRPAEGSRLAPLRRLLDVLAANVGRARNAPPGPPPGSVPGLVLALLLGAGTLAACATTEAGQSVQVEAARTTLAIAGAALAARGGDLPPEVVAGLHAALAAAAEAIAAWDAAPADSAASQLAAARLALLLAGMREAHVALAAGT